MKAMTCGAALLVLLSAAPVAGAADIEMDIRLPGVRIHIGDRDHDGRHWDGERWREARWWRANCERLQRRKDFRGKCAPEPEPEGRHCPPGQAKKGRC